MLKSTRTFPWPTIVGLFIALGIPFVSIAVTHQSNGRLGDVTADYGIIAKELALFAVLLAIVVLWERRPLASVGWRPVRLADVGAMLLMLVLTFVGSGIAFAIGNAIAPGKMPTPATEMAGILAVPVALRVAVGLVAGISEEFVYRAYAIERLTELTRSPVVGAVVPCVLFTLVHIPRYGFGVGLLPVLAMAIAATVLYLWRRNLPMNIALHAIIDVYGLVVQPAIGHH
jgi:membrane protease YdiL (CAAX protease family)